MESVNGTELEFSLILCEIMRSLGCKGKKVLIFSLSSPRNVSFMYISFYLWVCKRQNINETKRKENVKMRSRIKF